MTAPRASFDHNPDEPAASVQFLKRTRAELRSLRFVRLWKDKFRVYDVNGDYFEVRGLGYGDEAVVPLLQEVGAAYDPATLHQPTDLEYKEFRTSRRHPWAEDRVM